MNIGKVTRLKIQGISQMKHSSLLSHHLHKTFFVVGDISIGVAGKIGKISFGVCMSLVLEIN